MSGFVKAAHVFTHHGARTKEDALAFLSNKAIELGLSKDEAGVLRSFHAREEEGTTGMLNGFAIPHAKTDAIDEAGVFIVKFENAIEDWGSLDGEPIRIAIALLIPDSQANTTHIKLLSKIAVMLMDEAFQSFLNDCDDTAEIAEAINERLDA